MDETMDVAPGGIGSMQPQSEQDAFFKAAQEAGPQKIAQDSISAARELDPRTTDQFVERLRALNLPPDVIDALIMMVDALLKDPQNYAQNRQELIDNGVPAELLPEQFDAEFLGAMKLGLQGIQETPVQRFASGGIVELRPIAKAMAKMGRGGDTHLVHVNSKELRALKSMGGVGTINPYTGLQEFGFLGKIGKAVGNVFKGAKKLVSNIGDAVKDFASSSVGRIVTTIALTAFLGPAGIGLTSSTVLASGLAGAGTTLLGGGSLKDALKSGLLAAGTAYGLQELGAIGADQPPVTDTGSARDALLARGELTGGINVPESAALPGPEITPVSAPTVSQLAPQVGAGPASAPPIQQASVTNARDALLARSAPTPPVAPGGIENARDALLARPAPTPSVAPGGIENARDALLARPAPGMGPNLSGLPAEAPDMINMSKVPYQGTAPGSLYDQYLGKPVQSATDFYNEYFSPSRGMLSNEQLQNKASEILARDTSGKMTYETALKMAEKAQPGIVSQYGPLALAGVGLGAATGFFDTPEPPTYQPGPTGYDLLRQYPNQFGLNYGGTRTYRYVPAPGGGFTRQYTSVARAKDGGVMSLNKFPRKTGQIDGPGTETSDSIPAKLSDGEFVMTARAVRGMGNGSRRLGAKRMYQLMAALEKRASKKA